MLILMNMMRYIDYIIEEASAIFENIKFDRSLLNDLPRLLMMRTTCARCRWHINNRRSFFKSTRALLVVCLF